MSPLTASQLIAEEQIPVLIREGVLEDEYDFSVMEAMIRIGQEIAQREIKRKAEKKAYRRAYYLANREMFLASSRNYVLNHPEQRRATVRAYYLANWERMAAYSKEYDATHRELKLAIARKHYVNHKEDIQEWQRTKVKCPCGGKYTLANKAAHERCNKHIKFMDV